jgi:hypothetical protein
LNAFVLQIRWVCFNQAIDCAAFVCDFDFALYTQFLRFPMTFSSLHQSLIPSVLLSGAVFGAATLPLAAMSSNTISIDVQDQSVFSGTVDDLAVPYLSLAAAASLGVGLLSISMAGWRASSRKFAEVEEKAQELQRHLQEKEAELEALKFSEQRLQPDLVENFLYHESDHRPAHSAVVSQPTHDGAHYGISLSHASAQTVEMTGATVPKPGAIASHQVMASIKTGPTTSVAPAAHRPTNSPSVSHAPTVRVQTTHSSHPMAGSLPTAQAIQEATSEQLSELLDYLKQVMVQMEQRKGSTAS